MYIKRTIIAGKTIEIKKLHTVTTYKGKREPREKSTPEKTKKYNSKIAMDKFRQKINCNFKKGDYHLIFTYKGRPQPELVKQHMKYALDKARKEYKKCGQVLKYVYVTGYKNKDGDVNEDLVHTETRLHHHMIVNKCDTNIWVDIWEKHGQVWIFPLGSSGDYTDLANYLINHTNNIFRDSDIPIAQRYSCSRNLKKPKVKTKIVNAASWRRDPTAPRGYIVVTDSIECGVSDVTGYPYLCYRCVKIE